MYPRRYFPGRYFPGTYFPGGSPPPTPSPFGPSLIACYVNGVERAAYLYYGAANSWNLMRGSRGQATLAFVIEPGDPFAPRAGETVEIWDPITTRVWAGHIETVAITFLGDDGWHVTAITAISLEALFDTASLDKVKYTNTAAGTIFAALFAASGVTGVSLGTISPGVIVSALDVTNIAQAYDQLALLSGYVWYVDPADKSLYYHAPGDRPAAWTVGDGDILWESSQWRQSAQDFRNTQVVQLPSQALAPVVQTFAGNDTTTAFTLATVPDYVVSIDLSIGSTGRTISWSPGSDTVTVTPAPPTGSTLTVKYADSGQVSVSTASPGIGAKTARYTRVRTFTEAGALQFATAMIARYSMLPSTLQLSTDKPGIGIARKLTVAITAPLEADGLLNGDWLVQEVEAQIVPGLDQRTDLFGHFRYTLHCVNTAATAIFQGDGTTTTFVLPEAPSAVPRLTTTAPGITLTWPFGTNYCTSSAPIPVGDSVAIDYIGANAPDVPTFVNTWDQIAGAGSGDTAAQSLLGEQPPPSSVGDAPPQVFTRTLTLTDLTVGDDIAPHTPIYHDGTALRLLGVLRKDIGADLTVRINKDNIELITVTIPNGTMIDDVLEWSLAQGSPAVLPPFYDKQVLTADILESDGSQNVNGIAQFTVEWEFS